MYFGKENGYFIADNSKIQSFPEKDVGIEHCGFNGSWLERCELTEDIRGLTKFDFYELWLQHVLLTHFPYISQGFWPRISTSKN